MRGVKCSGNHYICGSDDSTHPPKSTKHRNVFLLTCGKCLTSVHVYMVGNYRILRAPTREELRVAYGMSQNDAVKNKG